MLQEQESRRYRCNVCFSYAGRSLKSVVRHIGQTHAFEANFRVSCGVFGCPRVYYNFHSYKKHLYRKHRDVLDNCDTPTSYFISQLQNDESSSFQEDNINFLDLSTDSQPNTLESSSMSLCYKRQAALFLLKLKFEGRVPQRAFESLIGDVTLLIQQSVSQIEKQLYALDPSLMTNHTDIKCFLQSLSLLQPFDGIHTNYLLNKYMEEQLHFVVREIT